VVSLAKDDSDPSFVTKLTVPKDAVPPGITLVAQCGSGEFAGPRATAHFRVEPDTAPDESPSMKLSQTTGPAGTRVTADGAGFHRCSKGVSLSWQLWLAEPVTAAVDPKGTFRAEIEVPPSAKPGKQILEAGCAPGEPGALVATPFTVLAAAGPTSGASTSAVSTTTTPPPTAEPRPSPITSTGSEPGTSGQASDNSGQASGDSTSHAGSDLIRPVRLTSTLAGADLLRPSLTVLLAVGLLAALLILLIAFPAELFNKTYEKNRHEIHWLLGQIGLRRHRLPPVLGLSLFVLLGAALSAMLAGDEGADGNPVAQVIGFAVAIPIVTFTYGLPTEAYARGRSGVPARLQVLPAALTVTLVCAVLSWLLKLDPPYLYGLFAGYAALGTRRLGRAHEGFGTLLGVVCLVGCALLAWFAWNPVHGMAYGPRPTWTAVIADAALFWIFVLATESLVFALPPLRFLDGRKLREWHLAHWLIPQTVAVGLFVYVFILLRGQLDPPDGGIQAVLKALLFFAIFAALSIAFWAYFRWDRRPTRHAS
jgi:hypothetical protein